MMKMMTMTQVEYDLDKFVCSFSVRLVVLKKDIYIYKKAWCGSVWFGTTLFALVKDDRNTKDKDRQRERGTFNVILNLDPLVNF